MTPVQAVDQQLGDLAGKWRTAVTNEHREAESVCMKRINTLLDQRNTLTHTLRPLPTSAGG